MLWLSLPIFYSNPYLSRTHPSSRLQTSFLGVGFLSPDNLLQVKVKSFRQIDTFLSHSAIFFPETQWGGNCASIVSRLDQTPPGPWHSTLGTADWKDILASRIWKSTDSPGHCQIKLQGLLSQLIKVSQPEMSSVHFPAQVLPGH